MSTSAPGNQHVRPTKLRPRNVRGSSPNSSVAHVDFRGRKPTPGTDEGATPVHPSRMSTSAAENRHSGRTKARLRSDPGSSVAYVDFRGRKPTRATDEGSTPGGPVHPSRMPTSAVEHRRLRRTKTRARSVRGTSPRTSVANADFRDRKPTPATDEDSDPETTPERRRIHPSQTSTSGPGNRRMRRTKTRPLERTPFIRRECRLFGQKIDTCDGLTPEPGASAVRRRLNPSRKSTSGPENRHSGRTNARPRNTVPLPSS
jgi:hypothetical protein